MKMKPLDRIFLLLTGLLAAYQVSVGIDGLDTIPVLAYTIAFGVLLVAGLLLILLGFEVLSSPFVVLIATLIPLSLATGLVWQFLPEYRGGYLLFAGLGFAGIALTRISPVPGRAPVLVLAFTHGIAGLTIFLLPVILAFSGQVPPGFSLVGLGGALMGIGGLLLSFLKIGHPVLTGSQILGILPGLLFLMTAAFTAGFRAL